MVTYSSKVVTYSSKVVTYISNIEIKAIKVVIYSKAGYTLVNLKLMQVN